MKELDYNEYLFAILHSDEIVNYSLSDYKVMTRFLEKEV